MDERAFEQLMSRAAATTAYPPTPQLRNRVLARIGDTAPSARLPRIFFAAAAAFAALVVAAVLAIPASRSAVAAFFGIEGSTVERLPTAASGTPTPFPTPAEVQAIATPLSLVEARALVDFEPAFPSIGAPQQIYTPDWGAPVLILHYDDFDLWETSQGGFGKGLPEGTLLQDVTVRGRPARWLSGASHIVTFTDAAGNELVVSQRTVDRNTLVWRGESLLYRIETDLPLAEAMRIAESLP
jgi:hypothetical protein